MAAVTPLELFEKRHVKPKVGRTLLIGSKLYPGRVDRRGLFSDAVGLDMLPGEGVDLVCNLEEPLPDIGQFAHIECLSVLEHSRAPWILASNVERLLEPGGTLFVAAPFVHEFHAYPNDFFRFTTEGVKLLFPGVAFEAMGMAHRELSYKAKVGRAKIDGFPYFPRCEVAGFGVKK